jgi:hypothetical protein
MSHYDLVFTNLWKWQDGNRFKSSLMKIESQIHSLQHGWVWPRYRRFSVNTKTLPVWIPDTISQSDESQHIYSVSLSYLPVGAITPFQQTFINYLATPECKCNSYSSSSTGSTSIRWGLPMHFLFSGSSSHLVFETYQSCFRSSFTSSNGWLLRSKRSAPPIITWNSENNSASIVAESEYYNNNMVDSSSSLKILKQFKCTSIVLCLQCLPSFPCVNYGISASNGQKV